jgi:hypothetical protein
MRVDDDPRATDCGGSEVRIILAESLKCGLLSQSQTSSIAHGNSTSFCDGRGRFTGSVIDASVQFNGVGAVDPIIQACSGARLCAGPSWALQGLSTAVRAI